MSKDSVYFSTDFVNWRWFHNAKILHVFIWLLLEANEEDRFRGKDSIPRGSLVATNEMIAEECGLTIQNVRTALANLEKTGEISRERRNFYQIISVTDYEKYKRRS